MTLAEPVVSVARLVYAGSAAIYGVMAVLYLVAPPTEPHLLIAAVFGLVGVFLAILALLIPAIPVRWIEGLVLLSIVVAEAGALSFIPLTGDAKQSVVVLIVIVAAGAVSPTVRSSIAGTAFAMVGWLWLARGFSTPDLMHWGVNIAGAGIVSIAVSTARLRAIADLRLTRFTIDRATDAIFLITPNGRFYYVNDAACSMLGYTRDELLRMSVLDINPVLTAEIWLAHWEDLTRRRKFVVPSFHRTKDGRTIPVEISINLAAFDGREYNCAIARDVTERRLAEARLKNAMHAAEAASRAKSDFLATMSHEIRTPLNGVFGMTELALDTEDPGERREFILRARASAETLLLLLDDILDYSRMEVGRLPLEKTDFDPRDLLTELERVLGFEAARRHLELRLHCDRSLPELASGDPRRLRQILLNLAINALKFTERGEVELRLDVESRDDQSFELVGSVRDTGIGIPPDKLSMIFQAFTQVDSSDSRRYGGAGLGLAIVQQLVQTMGGTVGVTSTLGTGSTFTFRVRLPIARAAQDHPLAH